MEWRSIGDDQKERILTGQKETCFIDQREMALGPCRREIGSALQLALSVTQTALIQMILPCVALVKAEVQGEDSLGMDENSLV